MASKKKTTKLKENWPSYDKGTTLESGTIEDPKAYEEAKVAGRITELSDGSNKLTFSMYCSLKKIPMRRRAGMRAYTKLERTTLAEWEKVFETY